MSKTFQKKRNPFQLTSCFGKPRAEVVRWPHSLVVRRRCGRDFAREKSFGSARFGKIYPVRKCARNDNTRDLSVMHATVAAVTSTTPRVNWGRGGERCFASCLRASPNDQQRCYQHNHTGW